MRKKLCRTNPKTRSTGKKIYIREIKRTVKHIISDDIQRIKGVECRLFKNILAILKSRLVTSSVVAYIQYHNILIAIERFE